MALGVDVGSGMTQWMSSKGVQGKMPSLVAEWDPATMSGTLDNPYLVKVGHIGTTFLVGSKVPLVTTEVADTLRDDWSGSDPWLALFYAALDQSQVLDGAGEIHVAVGVPQALYREMGRYLSDRLTGHHRFAIDGREYGVDLKVRVYPQASSAMASVPSLSDVEMAGLIDVGTYTTGLSVMQHVDGEFIINHTMSGGIARGTSVLARSLQAYLDTHHQMRMDLYRVYPLLDKKVVKIRGKDVDLAHAVDSACVALAEDIVEAADRAFRGGSELEVIALVGGGARYVEHKLKKAYPQLHMSKNPEWAVVEGLLAYAEAAEAS